MERKTVPVILTAILAVAAAALIIFMVSQSRLTENPETGNRSLSHSSSDELPAGLVEPGALEPLKPAEAPLEPGQARSSGQQVGAPGVGAGQPEAVTVEETGASYAVAPAAEDEADGWFTTEQSAAMMLSGVDFNNAGGPLLFNHPGGVASDGTRLYMADRNNNRILVWSQAPTSDNQEPDLVLGQPDFTQNAPGEGADQLNWPVSVASDGRRLYVTDTYNDRILIWNEPPTRNQQPADVILKSTGDRNADGAIVWPWAVWSDGEKLVVTSTMASTVLIWDGIPTEYREPDLTLTQGFGTPRSIASNGQVLAIGDHNATLNQPATLFWNSFPTSDRAADFSITDPKALGEAKRSSPEGEPMPSRGQVMWMTMDQDDRLYAFSGSALVVWNEFPTSATAPDIILDESEYYEAGDGSGLAVVGDRLYASLSNGNKIISFSALPKDNDSSPDVVIGSPNLLTNTLETNFIISNPIPATNGKQLFVSSDFDRKLYVWKQLPNESGAQPDLVYSLPDAPWDNALYEDTFVAAGRNTVFIWENGLPQTGAEPTVLSRQIGSVKLGDIQGVALDGQYLYISDREAGAIYLWEGVPRKNDEPKYVVPIERPGRLSSDGTFLAVQRLEGRTPIQLFTISELSDNAQPQPITGENFNLPQSAMVANGHLFVADNVNNRVVIWSSIERALSGSAPDTFLGTTETASAPQIGQDSLFWPAGLAFDGKYLWVGEFKFSERLLRFDATK